jgi:hypothetical protein
LSPGRYTAPATSPEMSRVLRICHRESRVVVAGTAAAPNAVIQVSRTTVPKAESSDCASHSRDRPHGHDTAPRRSQAAARQPPATPPAAMCHPMGGRRLLYAGTRCAVDT